MSSPDSFLRLMEFSVICSRFTAEWIENKNDSLGFAYDTLSYCHYSSADLSNVSHPEEYHKKLGNTVRLKDSPSGWDNETPLKNSY